MTTEGSPVLDSLLSAPSVKEELEAGLSSVLRQELGEWLSRGQIVLTSVDLSEPLGLSGRALQRRLKHLLAAALIREGNIDLLTAAMVASVDPSELASVLEGPGMEDGL